MSHQTGIQASEDLRQFLATVKDGHVRLMKVGIIDEALVLEDHKEVNGTWEEDYDACVVPCLEESQPCYIFYRLDTQNNQGYEWLFIAYSPDHSEVRQKMLYAGTRSTMKVEFGGGHIHDEIFGTAVADVNLSGYKRHITSSEAPQPLTQAEIELAEVKQQHTDAVHHSNANTLPGITFPIADDAVDALVQIRDKQLTYVQLAIDIDNEIIILKETDDIELEALPSKVPSDAARYHLFLFKHTHEGDYLESIVFVYSMPGYSLPVKERMLYSSSKAHLLNACESALQMEIGKKLEITEGSELTEEFLQDELHPKKNLHRPKFDKPKGPPGRGARRIVKKNADGGGEE